MHTNNHDFRMRLIYGISYDKKLISSFENFAPLCQKRERIVVKFLIKN